MYTDHINLIDVNDIITYLEIKNLHFNNCYVKQYLESVFQFTSVIWDNIDLEMYTKHDKDHSMKLIRYFMDLNILYEWSDYEKFIFASAALLHDIGMQFNRWESEQANIDDFPSKKLSVDEVRENHTILGYKLIKQQIKHLAYKSIQYPFSFPPLIGISEIGQYEALNRASHIAFSHSGNEIINLLPHNASWDSRKIEDYFYRPRLLAGVIRLCDEFDGDYTRIEHPEKLFSRKLDDISKIHWLSCIFIEDTLLSVKNDVLYIDLRWRIPTESTIEVKNHIRNLISKMRISKIINESEFVNKFFNACDEPQNIKQIRVNPLNENPVNVIFPLSDQLVRTIEKANSLMTNIPTQSTRENTNSYHPKIAPIINNGNKKDEQKIKPITNGIPLQDRLRLWFYENAESGHFKLISNEHTDTYLHCRNLVSDQNLLLKISDYIFEIYKESNINCILAVGTSAIPLSTNIALRFQANVTYTVSYIKLQSTLNKFDDSYIPLELNPTLKQNSNILIIDDVISGGNVAKNILDLIFDSKIRPNSIYHFAIFKLGNREHIQDKRVTSYKHIIHIPEVMYAHQEEDCSYCLSGSSPKNEIEMF